MLHRALALDEVGERFRSWIDPPKNGSYRNPDLKVPGHPCFCQRTTRMNEPAPLSGRGHIDTGRKPYAAGFSPLPASVCFGAGAGSAAGSFAGSTGIGAGFVVSSVMIVVGEMVLQVLKQTRPPRY